MVQQSRHAFPLTSSSISAPPRGPDPVRFAYHSSSWWQAPVEKLIGEIAGLGYQGIDLVPHPAQLPPSAWTPQQAWQLRDAAETFGVAIASLDLGGPHLLGAAPHEPSLLSLHPIQREERLDLLRRGIAFAAELGTGLVTLPSGPLSPDIAAGIAKLHFLEGLEQALEVARSFDVQLAIEPAPGHLIEGYNAFAELRLIFGKGAIGLCYDLASARCRYEDAAAVMAEADALCHIRLSDLPGEAHGHGLLHDDGIGLEPLLTRCAAPAYAGFISIKLPEHFTDPLPAAKRALAAVQSGRRSPDAG